MTKLEKLKKDYQDILINWIDKDYDRKSVCSDCKGHGLMADHKWRYFKCPKCKGSGETVF